MMQRFIAPLAASSLPFVGLLDHYGLLFVFLFVLVENFGAPIPGETMLVAASAYAATGHLNIVLIVLCCIAGVWTGSTLSYIAGLRGGVALLRRLHVPDRELERAQGYMDRWGGHTVLLGRYIAFLRSYIGWLAGINRMAPLPFVLWNLAGATAWTVTFAALGFLLGNNWALVERIFKVVGYGGIAVVVIAVVAFLIYNRRRRLHAVASSEDVDAPEEPHEPTLTGSGKSM